MPNIYWSLGDVVVPSNGIGIPDDPTDPAFQGNVRAALTAIEATPNGASLLQAIINRIPAQRVGIIKSNNENSCRSLEWTGARTRLAEDYGQGKNDDVVNQIKFALNMTQHDAAWFVSHIQQTPAYVILGPPVAAPSNFPITALDVQCWLQYERPYPYPFKDQDAKTLSNLIMIVIDRMGQHIPGAGASSRVAWNPARTTVTWTSGNVENRPPYIGLAHELVHAYYNVIGGQLAHSEDADHYSGVLFEYMAVGLGPWQNNPLSENGVRAGVVPPIGPRPMY
jgi:Effector protein